MAEVDAPMSVTIVQSDIRKRHLIHAQVNWVAESPVLLAARAKEAIRMLTRN